MSEKRSPEHILFELLVLPGNIEQFVLHNFPSEAIPTEALRVVYDWSVEYFHTGGNVAAPTIDVYRETTIPHYSPPKSFYDLLNENEIFLDEEPQESVEWVIQELKGRYITFEAKKRWDKTIEDVYEAYQPERPALIAAYGNDLVALGLSMEPRITRVDMREEGEELLRDYESRKADNSTHIGMHFGLPEIDSHTYGIHPGELAVLAAYAKTGKSYFVDWVALREFEAGRSVALFTLENSIKMTEGRLACLATGIDPTRWAHGESTEEEEAAVHAWVNESLHTSTSSLHVIQPAPGDRSAESMVNKAKLLNADSLIIDQLTFVEVPDSRQSRYLQIRDITHRIKELISTGTNTMPCLLAHQVNREGFKLAQKQGFYEMHHMAEGSEVERTADWVFSMFQTPDHEQLNHLLFQTLASRRTITRNWDLHWDMSIGRIGVIGESVLA